MERRWTSEISSVHNHIIEKDHIGEINSLRAQLLKQDDGTDASLKLRVVEMTESSIKGSISAAPHWRGDDTCPAAPVHVSDVR